MFTTPPVYAVISRRYLFGPERWVEVQLYDKSGREMGRSSSPEAEAREFFAGKGISLVTRAQLLRLKARPNPRSGLSKRSGKTEDSRGCEFEYTVYVTRGVWSEDEERLYVSQFGDQAKSLEGLRRIVGQRSGQANPARYWGRAGAGVLLACDGEVLLVLRSQHVQEPGTWGIPGGSCDGEAMFGRGKGRAVDLETARDCALAELEEELGPLPQDLDLDEQDVITYQDRGFTYTTFVMAMWPERRRRLDAGIALNWENDVFRWFTVPEALALPNLHFGTRYVLEKISAEERR